MTEISGRFDRRNYWLNASEGAFWAGGASLLSAQTVLPALLVRLGGGNVEVGALSVIVYLGVFLPQVLASRYVERLPWKKPWVVGFGIAQRLTVLVVGMTIVLLARRHPAVVLPLFFVLLTLNQLLTGISTPAWFDLFAKLTPVHRRGRLTGTRNAMAGSVAFACGFLLIWILGAFVFPFNYGLVFLLAFLLQAVSIALQARLVEEYPSRVAAPRSVREYFAALPDLISETPGFRPFLIASMFLVLATMSAGFFALYALKALQAGESQVGAFTLVMVVGQVAGALAIGRLADRYGNKLAVLIAAAGLLLAAVWGLLAPTLAWFMPVFFLLGINLGSELMSRYNLAIEYGSPEQRSTIIGLMNTVLAPFYLSGLFAGWVSTMFGYRTVFALGALCSTAGVALLIAAVKEPRQRRKEPPPQAR